MKNNIRYERTQKSITQEELGKKVGVSRQTINAIEVNKYVPSTIISLKIAKVLQKKVEELFLLEAFD